MKNKILILNTKSYKEDLINSTIYYANKNNINYFIEIIDNIHLINFDEFDLIFFPINLPFIIKNLDFIDTINPNIPLVFDIDQPINDTNFLPKHKKIIFRSAFGQNLDNINCKLIVPMLPKPIKYEKTSIKKDVIMLDVKSFHHAADTHFYVLSILSHLAREWLILEDIVGHKLHLYLTTFMKLEEYENIFNSLVNQNQFRMVKKNTFEILKSRLIKNIESNEEFQNLKYKTRLFITEHGNIADADLVQAMCLKTPIITYKRYLFTRSSGFHHSRIDALKLLNPNIKKILKKANTLRLKEEHGLRNIIKIEEIPYWENFEYEKMFVKSYDMIFNYALKNHNNPKMNMKMNNGYFRHGIELDEKGFKTIENILRKESR